MFGKGVYFADMSSKSANYCFTSPDKNTGVLMLSEVVIGDPMYERLQSEYITPPLEKGKLACYGMGKTMPDPKQLQVVNGVEVPLGTPVRNPRVPDRGALLYKYVIDSVVEMMLWFYLTHLLQ